jgi:hypothetical protein
MSDGPRQFRHRDAKVTCDTALAKLVGRGAASERRLANDNAALS